MYLLFAADLVYLLVHLLYMHTPILNAGEFKLGRERGHAENFQYLKEFWTGLLLGVCWLRTRSPAMLFWSFVFFYFLADDSIRLHERGGHWLGRMVDDAGFYKALGEGHDLGQVIYMGIAGIIFLIILFCAYRFSGPAERRISQIFLVLVFVLVAFAGGVDFIHSFLPTHMWDSILTALEEGGEHVVMTVSLAYAFSLLGRYGLGIKNGADDTF